MNRILNCWGQLRIAAFYSKILQLEEYKRGTVGKHYND